MHKVVLSIVFSLFFHIAFSQQRCGNSAYMSFLYSKNPGLKAQHDLFNKALNERLDAMKKSKTAQIASEVIYEIPVVVHVIHDNTSGAIGGYNIPDAQILSQIEVLNEDYRRLNSDTSSTIALYKSVAADIKIQFCLAILDPEGNITNGINRVYNKQAVFSINEETKLKSLASWPSDQYLNIWVCGLTNSYLGYSSFPNNSTLNGLDAFEGNESLDGVVIDYQYFGIVAGNTSGYDKGRTLTHEVGHWLGLLHIWGDSDCGDDFVSDTPPQEDFTSGKTCNTTLTSSCSGPTTVNMNQNYMDYSADACMNLFSQGQKDRMRTVMQMSPTRNALLNSRGCCLPEKKISIPYKLTFEDQDYLNEGWRILNFDASSAYSKAWVQATPGAYGESVNALRIENDSIYTAVTTQYWDVLESPIVNFNAAEHPVLDFDLAYAYGLSSNQTDSLVIYYTANCKGKWDVYQVIAGSDLVSTTRRTTVFNPQVDEWKKITVDLSALKNNGYVKFRIAVFSKGVNPLYIDNINFYKTSGNFDLKLYPVPVGDVLNVEVIYTGYKDVKIEAFNTLGKKLFEIGKSATTSFIEPINVVDFGAGVYILRVTSGSSKVVRRFEVY